MDRQTDTGHYFYNAYGSGGIITRQCGALYVLMQILVMFSLAVLATVLIPWAVTRSNGQTVDALRCLPLIIII